MNYIIKKRGQGKTFSLIQEAAWKQLTIICVNKGQEDYVWDKAKEMLERGHINRLPPKPIRYTQLPRMRGLVDVRYAIDEAGLLLSRLLDVPIETITLCDGYTEEQIRSY